MYKTFKLGKTKYSVFIANDGLRHKFTITKDYVVIFDARMPRIYDVYAEKKAKRYLKKNPPKKYQFFYLCGKYEPCFIDGGFSEGICQRRVLDADGILCCSDRCPVKQYESKDERDIIIMENSSPATSLSLGMNNQLLFETEIFEK